MKWKRLILKMSKMQVSDKIEENLLKTGTTCLALTFNGGVIIEFILQSL